MLIILMGKSASGKDTLREALLKAGEFKSYVSATTRPMREGEINGVTYDFMTEEEFNNTPMIESRSYNTLVGGVPAVWKYGTAIKDISDGNYIAIKDPLGAQLLKDHYGAENCKIIYLNINDDIRTERAMHRAGFDRTEWDRRLKADAEDFKHAEAVADKTFYGRNSIKSLTAAVKEYIN